MKGSSTCVLLLAILGFTTGQGLIEDIRLRQGVSNGVRDGRVEVQYNGIWGTICEDGFNSKDAGVVCRMLGYTGVAIPQFQSEDRFSPGGRTLRIWLDNLECEGDEATLDECQHIGVGSPNINCDHSQDVGVYCLGERVSTTSTTTTTPTTTTQPPRVCDNPSNNVRLLDGPNEAVGRIQVRQNAAWGEICDDRWGKEDAMVICRMLCYNPNNARALLGGTYGNRTQSLYHLDDLQCNGDEDDIFDCPANPGPDNCDITEAAAVSCLLDDDQARALPDPEIDCVVPDDRIVAKFPLSAEPRLRESHLTLTDPDFDETCGYTTSRDNNFVYISIPFIGCGTARELNFTHIIYSNQVHYDVPPVSDIITRSEVYDIHVICLMGRNGDPDEGLDPEGQTPPPQYGEGHPDLQIKLYQSNRFSTPIADLPARITLGEWVYVGVVLTTTDPDLKVVVQQCYTTPDEDRDSTPRYDLIVEKCKQEETLTFYPVSDTFFGFRFQAFKYYEGNHDFVYIHCKGIICDIDEKTGRCDRSCSVTDDSLAGRRRRDAHDVTFSATLGASQPDAGLVRRKRQLSNFTGMVVEGDQGPIYIIDPNQPPHTVTPGISITTVPSHVHPTPGVDVGNELSEDIENENELGTSSSSTACQQILCLLITMMIALLFS